MFITKTKIDWSEMDLFGHVNNVAYFKYFQSARVHFLSYLGINTSNPKDAQSFVVAECFCNYHQPLYYPVDIEIQTSVIWIKNSSFQLQHQILNSQSALCATGKDVVVLFDYSKNEKVFVSDNIRMLLNKY
jgi:acyl-CoA thioester hydrolase